MMNFKNEEAVSPVIGVILMVAITVILAAVIAAFVFGMGSNIETQKNVAVSVKQISEGNLQVTIQGGADLASLKYLRIEVTPSGASTTTYYAYTNGADKTVTSGSAPEEADCDPITVGSTYIASADLQAGSDHVVLVGHFADGRDQMLVDTTL